VTSDFYVERRFRAESNGQKEAKTAMRCGSVFQKDPTVAVTGFVKSSTVEKRKVLYEQLQTEYKALYSPHAIHLSSL
jgi:hypothetical protein